ncbi:MAG: hypothetical protein QM820_34490 [Minicystis sp.]
MPPITDPEVAALATISATLQIEYTAEGIEWLNSPFAWIKSRPSRQVGTIGERLVAGWLAAKDFDVVRSPDSDADRLVNGHRVEIKFSTLWKSGIYKFQQLRDQNYRFAICLGISPFDVHCWAIPKEELLVRWRRSIETGREVDGLQPQHGGADGRDTAWLTINPANPPGWLARFGGRLGSAAAVIEQIARRA